MNLALIEEIKKAFEAVEYPGDGNLVKYMKRADYYEMLLAFKSKHWQEVDIELAEYWRMDIPKFTPSGFQYYLPAFLIASLDENSDEVDAYLVPNLIPSTDSAQQEHFLQKISLLNQEQKNVIYKFFKELIRQYPNYLKSEKESTLAFWRPDTDYHELV